MSMYVGVSGTCRKVNKGYVGIGGVSKKILKGYIKIGSIAKVFWKDSSWTSKLRMAGQAPDLSNGRNGAAGASSNWFAIIAGGKGTANVDYYDQYATRSLATSLSTAKGGACAETHTYSQRTIVLGGGNTPEVPQSGSVSGTHLDVDFYDGQLTKTKLGNLSATTQRMASAITNTYILFAGGRTASSSYLNTVMAYDKNTGTLTYPEVLSAKTSGLCGASTYNGINIGTYAIAMFAGGNADSSYKVDIYNRSLAKSVFPNLSYTHNCGVGCGNGTGVIFAGGASGSSSPIDAVEYYNDLGTKTSLTNLSEKRLNLAGVNVGSCCVFGGGYRHGTNAWTQTVDAYDGNLTKVSVGQLVYPVNQPAGAAVKAFESDYKFGLIAGGNYWTNASGYPYANMYVVD